MSGSCSARQQNGYSWTILFLMEQQAALFQIADDVFVAIFDPAAAAVVGGFVGEFAVGSDAIEQIAGRAPDLELALLAHREHS